MNEIRFDGAGGPDVIRLVEAPVPVPGEGQVLIEVVAAGVNRPDAIQRAGHYPPPPGESDVPGLEVSGRVVARGPGVTSPVEGDEVCALLGSGGYADYALAWAGLCLPRPKALTLIEAGGLVETAFTVFDNVFTRGRLQRGERFLVHGGSSGIGTTAIQLAKSAGAEVFATAGSASKCAFCRTIGADHVIDYRTQDFVAEIKRLTDKRGVDVILDMVGGSYLDRNISILATDGRLVQIAFLGGPVSEKVNFLPVMVRRLTLTGSTLRARSLAEKTAVAEAVRAKVWPLYEAGEVKPIIHATFPLSETRQAHELLESSRHTGKILLLPDR
jgi:putative PIG3 family NAD(P)H quinone oxidoreductase